MNWDEMGCDVCRKKWLVGIGPKLLGFGEGTALHRCDCCGTYWQATPRLAYEISEDLAFRRFPFAKAQQ